LQTERENEERKEYIIQYRTEILTLFTNMLDNPENVNVSQEIHGVFESFIDKSVNYFIRTQKMLDPDTKFEEEDEDTDDDMDAQNTKRMQKKSQIFGAFNKHIYGAAMPPGSSGSKNIKKKSLSSYFGDDVTFN
jgi:hypothetical protein